MTNDQSQLTAHQACLTVDVEHDCPPFLETYRGIEEGMPKLLELFERRNVTATFFTTGDVVRRYPDVIRQVVAAGHELGCHGDTHRRFDNMSFDEARAELQAATQVLRQFHPVTSFRAPNLSLPEEYLSILEESGYQVDSSRTRYKPKHWLSKARPSQLRRIPASTTSSVLRLPTAIRRAAFRLLKHPAVLFVHPWEFVDFTRSSLRIDCRFRTGQAALDCLDESIGWLHGRGFVFRRISDL